MATAYYIPPAGVSPASFFLPGVDVVDPSKPPAILADSLSVSTGELTSMLTAPHPVDAAIREAFRVKRGSGASVQDIGHRFDRVRKMLPSTARDLQDEAAQVLKPFIDDGVVRLVSMEVEMNGSFDHAAMMIQYTNLLTGETQIQAL